MIEIDAELTTRHDMVRAMNHQPQNNKESSIVCCREKSVEGVLYYLFHEQATSTMYCLLQSVQDVGCVVVDHQDILSFLW